MAKKQKGHGKKFGMSRVEQLWRDYDIAESEGNERRMESIMNQIEELEVPQSMYEFEQEQKRGR